MEQVVASYFPILVFLASLTVLAAIMVFLPMLVSQHKSDKEKVSAYECGFEAFGDARGKFDVRFTWWRFCSFIFDLEVAFLSVGGVAEGSRCSRVLVDVGFWRCSRSLHL